MATVPSVSEVAADLDPRSYSSGELKDLLKAPTSAPSIQAGSSSALIHTLSIHARLLPPKAEFEYYGRPPERNPAFTSYTQLCTALQKRPDGSDIPCEIGIVKMETGLYVSVFPPPLISDGPRPPALLSFGGQRLGRKFPTGELHIGGGGEWSMSSAWDMQNWLHSIVALDPKQPPTRKGSYRDGIRRFRLDTRMKLWCDEDDGDDLVNGLITVDVYADFTALATQPQSDALADMVGLILHSLLPYDHDTSDPALAHFFSTMQPAPFFPPGEKASELQPVAMASKLLPFQLRTLRLLLERERGRQDDPTGSKALHGVRTTDPDGFWGTVKVKEDILGYRRITGDVHTLPARRKGKEKAGQGQQVGDGMVSLLDLSGVKGTMLCEEMGLGKTVEAIALVLSNRHPLSTPRAALQIPPPPTSAAEVDADEVEEDVPTIDLWHGLDLDDPRGVAEWAQAEEVAFKDARLWDESSQVHVAEVGATLIVTPPVLLKQWCAEIRTHAPALRVCVYEGWKSLSEGVRRKQAQLAKASAAAAKNAVRGNEAQKRKATAEQRRAIARKYAKVGDDSQGAGGAVGKIMVKEEVDCEIEEEEEVLPTRSRRNASASGSRSKSRTARTASVAAETEIEARSTLEITQREFERYVRSHDIVITTYQELAKDLTVAHPAPARSRRKNVNYASNERPRSPLVMCEWWRVIMDEVQLSGDQSAASEMVALIPRRNSLAVSGTPVKTDIRDLLGVLRFLRVPIIPHSPRLWYRLQQPAFRPAFSGLIQSLSIRTTKAQVSPELLIPRQNRWVIPIELNQVEQHYYLDTLSRQRDIIRRSAAASSSGGALDRALLRSCLLDLRQICTHIQVGMMLHAGGGAAGGPRDGGVRMHLGKELMTMQEALAKMKRDHTAEFMVESRNQIRTMIRLGQLIISNEAQEDRLQAAARAYEQARELTILQLTPAREELKRLLAEAGKDGSDGGDEVSDELSTPERDRPQNQTQHERERRLVLAQARSAIRELLIVLHQGWFLLGDVRHQQGDVEAENTAYNTADEIRKEILVAPLRSSRAAIARLNPDTLADITVRDLQTNDTKRRGGMVSTETILSINELLVIMNENAQLIMGWRQKIVELLQTPVEAPPEPESGSQAQAAEPAESSNAALHGSTSTNPPPEGKPEEDVYAKSLQFQSDVQAYLVAYAAALMDRKEMIKEERNLLVDVDAQRIAERRTKRAQEAREAGMEMGLYEAKGLLDELMLERQVFRDARAGVCERPLQAYLVNLSNLSSARRDEEVAIIQSAADMVRAYIKLQMKHFEELNKELDTFRGVFNHRVRYFAALQEISDSVSPLQLAKKADLNLLIDACRGEIVTKEIRLARMTTRGRYLDFLDAKQRDGVDADTIREDCLICMGSSEDAYGVLLDCGHFFCASCFKAFKSSSMRGCPSCRRDVNEDGITRIKIAAASTNDATEADKLQAMVDGAVGVGASTDTEAGAREDDPARQSTALREAEEQEFGRTRAEEAEKRQRDEEIRRIGMLDLQTRREIAHMDMMGEYGSKIDFLIKHLLYARARDPEKRHVVFSNWSDSLNIVTRALRQNGIKFASFDSKKKTKDVVDDFIKDTSITVFLLHAERESAGLTLTTCQVVHLLEPVLRHSFELQAIGRVDRLGQKNETTVYCYATRDTVESRILALGVRNGTSIYLKQDDPELQLGGSQENSHQQQNFASAAGKGGDLGKGEANEEELLGLIL